MHSQEKQVSYKTTNTYTTLNTLTKHTKTVWFVCHGMGYLSTYFITYFNQLDANTNYVIAAQAPNKYYQQPKMHVGANWLTRINTSTDMDNIIAYFDAIFKFESIPNNVKLIVFGYSQGVSVALRYVAKRQLQCAQIIIQSGGIPKALAPNDFNFLSTTTKVHLVYGLQDEYLDATRLKLDSKKAKTLFGNRLIITPFEGKHVVNKNFINNIDTT